MQWNLFHSLKANKLWSSFTCIEQLLINDFLVEWKREQMERKNGRNKWILMLNASNASDDVVVMEWVRFDKQKLKSHAEHMVTRLNWIVTRRKKMEWGADRKLLNFAANTYVCIIYYFHNRHFFPSSSSPSALYWNENRNNFSLFDTDTEFISPSNKKRQHEKLK